MSTITLKDNGRIKDQINHRMRSGPVKTKIIITEHGTGKVLGEVHNKILVPGSQITACKQFGWDIMREQYIYFPTYNEILDLDKTYEDPEQHEHPIPLNEPVTCLWCAGRNGAATSPNEIFVVNNTDHITERQILPFRYFAGGVEDLNVNDREIYYGKRTDGTTGDIYYYFKKFDTTPQLHINYTDGTEVTEDMWDTVTNQAVEIYVEMRLTVSRLDFRDWFEVIGWDNADVSTISLLTAWYTEEQDGSLGTFKYYQDVIPFSKFNFEPEKLTDKSRGIDFNYQVFY